MCYSVISHRALSTVDTDISSSSSASSSSGSSPHVINGTNVNYRTGSIATAIPSSLSLDSFPQNAIMKKGYKEDEEDVYESLFEKLFFSSHHSDVVNGKIEKATSISFNQENEKWQRKQKEEKEKQEEEKEKKEEHLKPIISEKESFVESCWCILPSEMRMEVFIFLVEQHEWLTLARASCVCKSWKEEIDEVWRNYCLRNKFFLDLEEWKYLGKSWKWLCVCLTRTFDKQEIKNGFGCYVSVLSEIRFEGEFKENKKEGVGRIWWSNGDRYVGDWKRDSKDGFGFMLWENGDRYEGHWKNDLRDGPNAKYSYANGGLFRGEYRSDERDGSGVFIWPDGDLFRGNWKSGGRNGKGVLVTMDGNVVEQTWNESPYINYSEKLPPKYPEPL